MLLLQGMLELGQPSRRAPKLIDALGPLIFLFVGGAGLLIFGLTHRALVAVFG